MNISDYLDEVRAKYASGQATEHSYRPALQKLFQLKGLGRKEKIQ